MATQQLAASGGRGEAAVGRELVRVLAERTEEVESATERLFPRAVSRSYSGGMDYTNGGTFGWDEDDIEDD